jgi:hypothetical protein
MCRSKMVQRKLTLSRNPASQIHVLMGLEARMGARRCGGAISLQELLDESSPPALL